jgi:DNA-binding NarL/FixJ family response regulator
MTASYLTVRQDQVMQLVADGCTNEEIAAELTVSTATVERHIEDIRHALGARNRAHAVWLSVRAGLLNPFEVAA